MSDKLLLANDAIPPSNLALSPQEPEIPDMVLDVVIIALGFIGLIWGADKFVLGASALAQSMGVSPMVIGLTIVAFGTSAPEIFSAAAAVWENQPELAIGNVLGSNIFNIGMVLGVTALISPLSPPKTLFRKEIPALLLVTLVTGILLANFYVGFWDAVVLLLILVYFAYRLFSNRLKSGQVPELDQDNLAQMPRARVFMYLFLGLALLVLSAEVLVKASISIAEELGVSSAIIGLTLIAVGTSLPEMAASISSALKGHYELAIGNIVGSNILNILLILPFPGLFAAGAIEPDFLIRDYTTMLLMTLVLALFCYLAIKRELRIGRVYGLVFLSMYAGWFTMVWLQIQAPSL